MFNKARGVGVGAWILVATLAATPVWGQVTLMDQIGPAAAAQNGQTANASQEFEAANAAFHIATLDDFVLGGQFQLTEIEVCTLGYSANWVSYANVQSWRVDIYSSPTAAQTNLVGDVAHVIVPIANATLVQPWTAAANSAKVTLDVSSFPSLNLNAGTYWIAVIPRLNFTGGGQIAVYQSSFAGTPGNANARQANPGGGFAIPGNLSALNANSAYRIKGTSAAPFPPSMIGGATPASVMPGDNVLLTATVTPGGNPTSTGLSVHVNLTQIGGSANALMFDDGTNGDVTGGDLVFSLATTIGANPPCGNILLPATVTDAQSRTANGNIALQTVTPLVPTPGAIPNDEPDCGLPTDTVNGGCNSTPNVFSSIACGQTVSGTVRGSTTTRDTDWYSITLNQQTQITLSIIAEANVNFGVISDTATPGVPPVCGSATLVISPFAQAIACSRTSLTTCLESGTWFFFVGTPFADYPCGRKYELSLRCGGGTCPADMNGDTFRNGLDVQAFADQFTACVAGGVLNCTTCQKSDVNGDGVMNGNDVSAFISLILAGTPCP